MDEPGRQTFVGRHAELETLLDALAAAEQRRGGIVLIGGEAGTGKSRLAEELARRAQARGARALWGRAGEAGTVPPYWPWLQVIRAYLAGEVGEPSAQLADTAESITRLLPELRELLPASDRGRNSEEQGARARIFQAIFALLRAGAERQTIVLLLDDLHDADPSSLLLLELVAGQVGDAAVLVVATYREEELRAGTAGRTTIRQIQRHPNARYMPLRGLEPADVAAYMHRTTGQEPAPRLVERLMEGTDGNALFVTEVIRHLDMRGRLASQPASAGDRLVLPESVRDVILERLSGLSPPCRDLLSAAAVLGREFELSLLEAVSQMPTDEMLENLDEAGAAHVVAALESVHRYRFSHGLVRDAVYDEIPSRRRLQLHLAVAEVLERVGGALVEERAGEITHHLQAAGSLADAGRLVHFASVGARHAVGRLAYEEAVRLYGAALATLDRTPDDMRRVDLLLGLGDALARSGEASRAKEEFFRAASIAQRLGLGEKLALAALGYGGRFVWEASRGDPHLLTLLNQALAALDREPTALRARLLARLAAGPLRDEADRARRDALSAEAVDIAARLDDPLTLAYVLDGRYAAIWGPDGLDERLATARQLIEVARRAGDRERELQGNHYLCLALLEKGDLPGAEAAAAEQRRLARELKQPAQLLYAMTVDTTLAVLQGRYAEAEALIPQATAVGARAEQAMSVIYSLFERYMIVRDRGNPGELLNELLDAAARFPTYVVINALVADAYRHAGRPSEAQSTLRRLAAGGFSGIPRNDEWLFSLAMLGDVAVETGDASVAEDLYRLLTPYENRVAVSAPDACAGAVARVLGRLAAMLGRLEDAERHLERAIGLNAGVNARAWLARTRYDLAPLVERRGEPDRAARLLAESAREAEALGMRSLAADAAALLSRIAGASAPELTRAFMFTDIVRSTELLSAIGDEAWDDVLRWHDAVLRELFARHGGEEIDHAGDGFFVAFSGPRAAIECAIAIQRRLAEHRRSAGFAPRVRIGIHADAARSRAGGYKGAGVHRAARLGSLAAGGEILVSRSTLSGFQRPAWAEAGDRTVTLKGFTEPVEVTSIRWTDEAGST